MIEDIYFQAVCVIMMLVCDVFILYKVYSMRSKTVLSTTLSESGYN